MEWVRHKTNLVHLDNRIDVDFAAEFLQHGIATILLRLQSESVQHLLLDLHIRDGFINALAIAGFDQLHKCLGVLLEFGLGDKFTEVNATRQGLQNVDIARRRRSVILLGLSAIGSRRQTDRWQHLLDVALLDRRIEVDIIAVQNLRVLQRLEDRLLESVLEEGIFVRRIIAANPGLQSFLLSEQVVHQTQVAIRDLDSAGYVDGLVERKLCTLDQVEGNRVFEATIGREISIID
jgi:hypothetical protein